MASEIGAPGGWAVDGAPPCGGDPTGVKDAVEGDVGTAGGDPANAAATGVATGGTATAAIGGIGGSDASDGGDCPEVDAAGGGALTDAGGAVTMPGVAAPVPGAAAGLSLSASFFAAGGGPGNVTV